MGNFSDFESGQLTGAHLAGATVTNTATLLGVPRVTVPKVMPAYEGNFSKEEQWLKINTERKRSSYTYDCLKKFEELLQYW
jgi:hypothetical protein